MKALINKPVLISLIVIAVTAGTPGAGPSAPAYASQVQDREAFIDRYERRFRQHAEAEHYPAAALAIVTRTRVLSLLALGHTDENLKQSVNINTVFRLASVSKTFAAGAIALLAEDGTVAWDDPVTRYVPEFQVQGDSSEIRLRHLLEHSAGLIPHAYDNLIEDGLSPERVIARLEELPYLCEPGDCYGYQNVVFNLVAPVAERASRLSYEQLVEQRIFKPLEMSDASLGYESFIASENRALPHVRAGGRWRTVKVEPHYYRLPAAAGINASISDMARWLRAQLGSHPNVISPGLVSYLTEPRLTTRRQLRRSHWRDSLESAHYGMGWRVYQFDDLPVIYHGGWVQGYRADVAFSPTLGLGIAILLNAEANSISELSAGFWEMALETGVSGYGFEDP